jgi:AraC family transcriptional regulator
MRKRTTRIEYGRRIARVAAYIDANLDGDLALETLAAVACFSPYHFHRIYRWVTGETVTDTVRRLRLFRASKELARPDVAIERVARRAGYGSVEAFTRAFAAGYGKPPGVFRAHQLAAGLTTGDTSMDVVIKTFPQAHVAVLPHRGDYNANNATFDRLAAWAAPRGLLDRPTRMLGVYYDDPDTVPESELRSEACIEVPPGTEVEDGITLETISAGRAACTVHKGPYTELGRAYRALYRDWLPHSGEEVDDRPPVEQYLNNPRDNPPSDWLTEIVLPLKG